MFGRHFVGGYPLPKQAGFGLGSNQNRFSTVAAFGQAFGAEQIEPALRLWAAVAIQTAASKQRRDLAVEIGRLSGGSSSAGKDCQRYGQQGSHGSNIDAGCSSGQRCHGGLAALKILLFSQDWLEACG
jgi:hypothetical protein